jgi:hypothetical protein
MDKDTFYKYDKYDKYKRKYLSLKSQTGGNVYDKCNFTWYLTAINSEIPHMLPAQVIDHINILYNQWAGSFNSTYVNITVDIPSISSVPFNVQFAFSRRSKLILKDINNNIIGRIVRGDAIGPCVIKPSKRSGDELERADKKIKNESGEIKHLSSTEASNLDTDIGLMDSTSHTPINRKIFKIVRKNNGSAAINMSDHNLHPKSEYQKNIGSEQAQSILPIQSSNLNEIMMDVSANNSDESLMNIHIDQNQHMRPKRNLNNIPNYAIEKDYTPNKIIEEIYEFKNTDGNVFKPNEGQDIIDLVNKLKAHGFITITYNLEKWIIESIAINSFTVYTMKQGIKQQKQLYYEKQTEPSKDRTDDILLKGIWEFELKNSISLFNKDFESYNPTNNNIYGEAQYRADYTAEKIKKIIDLGYNGSVITLDGRLRNTKAMIAANIPPKKIYLIERTGLVYIYEILYSFALYPNIMDRPNIIHGDICDIDKYIVAKQITNDVIAINFDFCGDIIDCVPIVINKFPKLLFFGVTQGKRNRTKTFDVFDKNNKFKLLRFFKQVMVDCKFYIASSIGNDKMDTNIDINQGIIEYIENDTTDNNNNDVLFEVKWQGYGRERNEWVSIDDFDSMMPIYKYLYKQVPNNRLKLINLLHQSSINNTNQQLKDKYDEIFNTLNKIEKCLPLKYEKGRKKCINFLKTQGP